MRELINWLLTAIGLKKRPPRIPSLRIPDPQPHPEPVSVPAPEFHGFWMRHGKFAYERELTKLQVSPQVTGCPPDEIRYGYEDNGSGPYQWRMEITEIVSGRKNAIYSQRGNRIDGQWSNDRYAVWFPLWCEDKPFFPFSSPAQMKGCPRPPAPDAQPEPRDTIAVRIDLWIKNAHGNEAHWKQVFEAVEAGCE